MSDADGDGARPHRFRKISSGVRIRFAECFPADTLAEFGAAFTEYLFDWYENNSTGPTWSRALAAYADDPTHPVHQLLAVPDGRNRQNWRSRAILILMERLRDDHWITVDNRPHSLRPAVL